MSDTYIPPGVLPTVVWRSRTGTIHAACRVCRVAVPIGRWATLRDAELAAHAHLHGDQHRAVDTARHPTRQEAA